MDNNFFYFVQIMKYYIQINYFVTMYDDEILYIPVYLGYDSKRARDKMFRRLTN